MASTTSNGMFLVTQYVSAVNPNPVQQRIPVDQTPSFLHRFIKGEPKALGALQIMIGVVYILLGIILFSSSYPPVSVYSGVAFWGALFFFISGGLSISAVKNGTLCLVKGSLGMNIVSSIAAGIAFILYVVDLCYDPYAYSCHSNNDNDNYYYYYYNYNYTYTYPYTYYNSWNNCTTKQALQLGVSAVLLILSMLEFCIAIATSAFGCKSVAVNSRSQAVQPVFIIQNAYSEDPRNHMTLTNGIPVGQGMPMAQGIAMPQGVPFTRGIPIGQGKQPSYGISTAEGIPTVQGVINAPIPTTLPPPSYYEEFHDVALSQRY